MPESHVTRTLSGILGTFPISLATPLPMVLTLSVKGREVQHGTGMDEISTYCVLEGATWGWGYGIGPPSGKEQEARWLDSGPPSPPC